MENCLLAISLVLFVLCEVELLMRLRRKAGRSMMTSLFSPVYGIVLCLVSFFGIRVNPTDIMCTAAVVTLLDLMPWATCSVRIFSGIILTAMIVASSVLAISLDPLFLSAYCIATLTLEFREGLKYPVHFMRMMNGAGMVSTIVVCSAMVAALVLSEIAGICCRMNHLPAYLCSLAVFIASMILYVYAFFCVIRDRQPGTRLGAYKVLEEASCERRKTIVIKSPDPDLKFKELFDRFETYFREEQPFLNPKMVLSDVYTALYTNKVYLSKAIKQYGGCTFCEYVNNARVDYAIELFKTDPDLRVSELAVRSGFLYDSTFSVAFRDKKHMSPGEWCREYRYKLVAAKTKGSQSGDIEPL